MSSCPNCGHANTDDHDFCKSCGTYLRWGEAPEESHTAVLEAVVLPSAALATFEEPPPPPPQHPPEQPAVRAPEPVREAVDDDAAVVTLRLTRDAGSSGGPVTAAVDAGGEVELFATVRNESGIVDDYDLRITGIPDGWWTIAPPVVYLVPFGAESGSYEQEVAVRLHPPRRPEAEARLWPIRLVAMSRARGTEAGSAGAGLVIAPYEEFESRVAPEHGHGESSARYAVPVRSGGNAPLAVSFRGEDPDGELSFAFDPPAFTLRPGGEDMSTVTVWAGRLVTQSQRERRFTIYVKGGEQALAGMATFVQLPAEEPTQVLPPAAPPPAVPPPAVEQPPVQRRSSRERLIQWRIAVTLLAVAMLIGGSFMDWAGHGGGSPANLRGACVSEDPSGCLRVDHYLSVVELGESEEPERSPLLNLVTSLGFLTIVLGVLALLGIQTGRGAWVVGALVVVLVILFLFTLHGNVGSRLGVWVVLLGGVLTMGAGVLATASRKDD